MEGIEVAMEFLKKRFQTKYGIKIIIIFK